MICVSVEVQEGELTYRAWITTSSIERALEIMGEEKPGRRVRLLFPIDPEVFLKAPTLLIIIGDSDIVRPEHAVEMFRLLGGVMGDLAGLPNSRLAILPGTTHVTLLERADWLVSMNGEFIDAPMPEAK